MVVAIHQPEHLPWLGFFNKMANADELVILDNVQYRKRYFQNRNKIIVNGDEKYIGVPVRLERYREKTISEMEICSDSEAPWKDKYLKTIEYNYKHHPFFDTYFPFFVNLLSRQIVSLYEFNMEIIEYFAKELDIKTKLIKASDLSPIGEKSDLILDIAQKSGADIYLSGPSGRDYMDLDKFERENMEVWFNDFRHPEYVQKGIDKFIPYMSTLDLLMNVGGEQGMKVIQSGTVITKCK